MKYIRDEFGIKQMSEDDLQKMFYGNIDKEHKISDSIEELCDGYYLEFGDEFDTVNVYDKDRFSNFKERYMQLNDTLTLNAYGFIETDKGLIYVAKMNDKMRAEFCKYKTPSGAWQDVLDTYRAKFMNKNTTVQEKWKIKEDFYHFTENFREEYIDWCWGYVALGKYGA